MDLVDQASHLRGLRTDRLALTVDPGFGARILHLIDLSTDREWLVQGPRAEDVSESAAFLGDASRGWDECFPTVLACDHTAWGGRLRDHGMLWGRPWEVIDAGRQHLETVFRADGIHFSRRLTLEGARVTAAYTVTSGRAQAVPYLWSQHCVLALTPDDRIILQGHEGAQTDGAAFDWPDVLGRDLSRVGTTDEGVAIKAYALTPGPASAAVRGPNGGLRFDWDGADVPALGLWFDYGGWPEGASIHQVALEPTTGAADDLVGAEALGQARMLAPGTTHKWMVTLMLTDRDEARAQ